MQPTFKEMWEKNKNFFQGLLFLLLIALLTCAVLYAYIDLSTGPKNELGWEAECEPQLWYYHDDFIQVMKPDEVIEYCPGK